MPHKLFTKLGSKVKGGLKKLRDAKGPSGGGDNPFASALAKKFPGLSQVLGKGQNEGDPFEAKLAEIIESKQAAGQPIAEGGFQNPFARTSLKRSTNASGEGEKKGFIEGGGIDRLARLFTQLGSTDISKAVREDLANDRKEKVQKQEIASDRAFQLQRDALAEKGQLRMARVLQDGRLEMQGREFDQENATITVKHTNGLTMQENGIQLQTIAQQQLSLLDNTLNQLRDNNLNRNATDRQDAEFQNANTVDQMKSTLTLSLAIGNYEVAETIVRKKMNNEPLTPVEEAAFNQALETKISDEHANAMQISLQQAFVRSVQGCAGAQTDQLGQQRPATIDEVEGCQIQAVSTVNAAAEIFGVTIDPKTDEDGQTFLQRRTNEASFEEIESAIPTMIESGEDISKILVRMSSDSQFTALPQEMKERLILSAREKAVEMKENLLTKPTQHGKIEEAAEGLPTATDLLTGSGAGAEFKLPDIFTKTASELELIRNN